MLTAIASVGAFIPGLFGKELSYKTAKIVGFIILGFALLALLRLGIWAYDRSVIEQHETEQRAEAAEATLEADRAADKEAEATATELAETKAQLDTATAEAAKAHPTEAAKGVGPVSKSYYDTLRKKENRR